jgi:uncharacterized protein YbbC (DUF1343 family)
MERLTRSLFWILFAIPFALISGEVLPGLEVFFLEGRESSLAGKRIGIVTNHTGVDREFRSTVDRFLAVADHYQVAALFSPEHGFDGRAYAWEKVGDGKRGEVPLYSLHGKTRRPTSEMLRGLDLIIYDIQCTGVRAYTYPTTLFYVMEEAAKRGIGVVVLDRPNPINGITLDGPLLEESWRSYIGYLNVPYCHGMTIGELARYFNEEYKIGCALEVVPMRGWRRSMSYRDTGLPWIPPSPNIPEPDTPLFCPMTGIMGELQILNIGIGFTLPFKIAGAPWIDADLFAAKLNAQKLPGVHFQPFHFRPFSGLYKGSDCHGVLIQITDSKTVRPVSVQYLILGMLKSLYPDEFRKRLPSQGTHYELFCKANGTEQVHHILSEEKYAVWKLIELHRKERSDFIEKRKKYLLDYPL